MSRLGRWLQNNPKALETAYRFTDRFFLAIHPLIRWIGYERFDTLSRAPEEFAKKVVFDCQMCGQCILHSTGMTCPMTCPKQLRNGPCGGVRHNGHCEVIPEMRCVWVEAFERSQNMQVYQHEMLLVQPPVNRRLEGSSAWVNALTGEDKVAPPGWRAAAKEPNLVSIDEILFHLSESA